MPNFENDPIISVSKVPGKPAVSGDCSAPNGIGVYGESQSAEGVRGVGHSGAGVTGTSEKWIGVYGESQSAEGVRGVGHSGAGVTGTSEKWTGVYGESQSDVGVRGVGHSGAGMAGTSEKWIGVYGESESADGVRGVSKSATQSGVAGVNAAGNGIYGEGRIAGYFKGDVEVTGDIRLVNADCAEAFTISDEVLAEPGTVMVLGHEYFLTPCDQPYDKRVAGVISGAGDFKPGIILDNQMSEQLRLPVALLGKVFCKADADFGEIRVGDLLTTSPTPGHAMKASDQQKAFGAVIGKALRPLKQGHGLIPILIALQ